MGFNVFLLLGFVSCVWGFRWSGPVASNLFQNNIENVCKSLYDEVKDVDACSGCLYSYSKLRQSQEAYDQMVRCGQTYFTEPPYDQCRNIVANNSENGANSSQTYCNFEKCISRVSTADLITECWKEASQAGATDNSTFFINVTTCILAKQRCRPDPNYQQFHGSQPRNNALYVTVGGQLEVTNNVYFDQVASPCNTGPDGQIIYEPNPNPNPQASWPSAQCSVAQPTTPFTNL